MKILMVCLGNICRSPLAEAMLRSKIYAAGLSNLVSLDSCGTSSYHEGDPPESRSTQNALENGLDISMLRSRPLTKQDFKEYDLIYCMDKSNLNDMRDIYNGDNFSKVDLLLNLSYPEENRAVPDPYFGGESGFQDVYDLVESACDILIKKLSKELK